MSEPMEVKVTGKEDPDEIVDALDRVMEEMVERGNVASFSDKYRFISQVDNPETMESLYEESLRLGRFPIVISFKV